MNPVFFGCLASNRYPNGPFFVEQAIFEPKETISYVAVS
jgi:hypothetical protein